MQAYWEFFTGANHMDSTKNEIPDGKLSFDIDVPKAEDLELEGTAAVNSAEFLVISDEDGLKRATFEMNAYTKRIKELEKARKTITGPLDASKKAVMNLFRPAIDGYTQAAGIIKHAIGRYVTEQERIAAEARAKAEAIAAEERRKLEEQAKAAEAAQAPEAAAVIRETAALVTAAPAVTAPAKVKGMSVKKVWKGQVVDLPAFLKAAAENPALAALVEVKQGALDKFISANGGTVTIPGVEVRQETQVASLSR